MVQFAHAIAEIFLVVVGLELGEPPVELTQPVLQFAEYRLGNAPLLRHDADRLAKGLLAAPDLFKPLMEIDGIVPALLFGYPLFSVRERRLKRYDGFLGVALGERLDRRVESGLRAMRGQNALSQAPEAVPQ
ncbi:hypothetical protein [Bradyrhizobium sp. JYMT SZCCT0180]|uniref:hypothetical protein n=1 Tax=Bradyrhizobium sp. JYMT SZCCT0180 TaxID=2807666 RepID=UPI0020138E6C|nr:hypothetical protein [Bradyrhizobium sp. JYMT SZCCT0180]